MDDDPLVLMSSVIMLENLGHTIVEASSAKAALAGLQTGGEIELLITDHALPHMSGLQLIEAVRQQ